MGLGIVIGDPGSFTFLLSFPQHKSLVLGVSLWPRDACHLTSRGDNICLGKKDISAHASAVGRETFLTQKTAPPVGPIAGIGAPAPTFAATEIGELRAWLLSLRGRRGFRWRMVGVCV